METVVFLILCRWVGTSPPPLLRLNPTKYKEPTPYIDIYLLGHASVHKKLDERHLNKKTFVLYFLGQVKLWSMLFS